MNEETTHQPKLETLAEREIYSDTGTAWRVREARAIEVPGAEPSTCLIFDSGQSCRRFWRYPAELRYLSAAALLALIDNPRRKCVD